MYLKALEVENFKSFKGEAIIPFDRGFTAITGPNGSGKSNCGDAVQFVLGARSAKVLRAQNSKDLIFNGGKSNRPARNAKVTLVFANPTLSNGRRRLPIDTDEVRMTREVRLTKSDNTVSTYLLNGEESNQKAFHRILGQANARPDGYNIVLQGDVTRLSSMTAMERRKVLDSVAGVTSYDDEIRKAERQRGQVEDFIERISLVEEEQKARLKTLEKEKAVAERAKDTKEEYDAANVTLQQSKHKSAKAEIKHHAEERARILGEAANAEQAVKDAEKILLSLDDKIGELETQISNAMGGDKGGLTKEIGDLQISLALKNDHIEEANSANQNDTEMLQILESDIDDAKTNLANHVENLQSAKLALEQSKAAFEEAESIEAEIRSTLENKGSATASLSRELSKANDDYEASRESVQMVIIEVEKISNEIEIIAQQLSDAEEDVEDARLSRDDIMLQIEELGDLDPDKDRSALAEELRSAQAAEKRLIDESSAVDRRLQEAERKLTAARTELEKRSGSNGMAPGAAAVMSAKERGDLRGIIGTISELCAPKDSGHSDALATAVGGGMNSIVVENDQMAAEAMNYLKSRKLGRATFLPLNKMQANRPSGKAAMSVNKPGVLGFAHELLDYDPRIATAVAYALRNTLVVDNISTARKLMGGVRLVTLGGEITEPGGAMIGGSRQKMKTGFGGKIHGASEVETLAGEVDRLSLIANTVAEALRAARNTQAEVRGKINSLAEDDQSVKSSGLKAELDVAKKLFNKQQGLASQLEKRLNNLESDHAGKLAMLESAKARMIESESTRDKAAEDLRNSSPDEIRQRLMAAQNKRVDAEVAANNAKLTLQSGTERQEILTEKLESLTSTADDIQAAMAGREKSLGEMKIAIEKETALLNEKESERAKLLEEHQELEAERVELVQERADIRAEANQKSNQAISSKSLAENISHSIVVLEQKLTDLLAEMAVEGVSIAEEGVDLPNVRDAEKLVNDLRRKLDRFGDFNMLAIEQYDVCKARLDEMKDDFKTLQQRRKRLIDITEKLESQRKTRLLATLKEVNKNFKVVYNRLSNGGRGELFLENPDEPFKGGLDMWAQPRGKSNKSRLQGLSGGEKSMASLSLIFAIQDHDPSPFYYFDEVDQNLDVPNSKLIATECRNRSEAAQFIMVTLRKVSLELADHHIGITHGGDGCSRRIVDFDRDRAIELGAEAEKEASKALDKNFSRIEEARVIAEEMPEVPDALPAPKSLGGLLDHIEQESEVSEETGFSALTERADELTEDIEERKKIVSELLDDQDPSIEVEEESEQEV